MWLSKPILMGGLIALLSCAFSCRTMTGFDGEKVKSEPVAFESFIGTFANRNSPGTASITMQDGRVVFSTDFPVAFSEMDIASPGVIFSFDKAMQEVDEIYSPQNNSFYGLTNADARLNLIRLHTLTNKLVKTQTVFTRPFKFVDSEEWQPYRQVVETLELANPNTLIYRRLASYAGQAPYQSAVLEFKRN